MVATFVHLKTHTEYSLIDGILRIKKMVAQAKAQDMPAIAITDHMNLFGLVKFYRAAVSVGVKPIVGADLIIREGDTQFNITALCQNQNGYRNLTEILSRAYIEGQQDGQPMLQWSWLAAASEGLIILSGGRQGDVGQALLVGNEELAKNKLQRWQQTFPNRFYVELQRTGRAQEEEYIHAVVKLAGEFNLPVVATNDVCFLNQDDFDAHEARVCINSGHVLEDAARPHHYSEQQYLKTSQAMQKLFADIPEALANSIEIAKRCNMQLILGKVHLPNFPVPEGVSLEHYFDEQAQQGLQQRLAHQAILSPEQQQPYQQRLAHELSVIKTMGFAGYFLIVADFIRWAKEQKIPVGPGRGSGAGSVVAYALGITELDPLQHELLFERFLNPERVSMPDFDIDFCMERRDQVIEYVAERYGRDAVSQIITYGTMAAKAVVRDVGRVLGMPYGYVDKIAKLIPFEIGMTLTKALEQEEQLAELYKKEEDITTLIDLAKKLEGITRNAGKHAGGVVIAPTKLTDFTPLYCEAGSSNAVTQFDKDDVESVGLVKFDFLGLRTLTIIDWALQTINKKLQQENLALIDIGKIPLNDTKTFQLLQSCATTAVFQLESRGMKELIRRLRPDSFDDITALVALFRPGPLQSGMVDDFIDRKHGRAAVHYPHPDLEPILNPTYGVILYQEQVMQIAQVLAGYSLGGADILRRAMGKKKPEEMAKQRAVFLEGASKRNIDKQVAEHIFDLMEKFAGYGFNKSHSAAYALIAYQTAWLKAHYPAEFMAAVLSSDMDNTDKVVGFLNECRNMGLTVSAPNVNVGHYTFTVNKNGEIEYGLGAIKGVGEAAVEHIVAERDQHGEFANLFAFCQRLDLHKVNRRVLDPLVRSGAMDCFQVNRASLVASIDKAIQAAEQRNRNENAGQTDLFGGAAAATLDDVEQSYVKEEQWNTQTKLAHEKETLGCYFSGHPLQDFEKEIAEFSTAQISGLAEVRRENVIIAGMVVAIRVIYTKKGKRMAVMTLEDRSGRIEITLFSKIYDEARGFLELDEIYVVKGKIEDDEYTGGIRMIAETIESLETVRQRLIKRLVIRVSDQNQVNEVLNDLPSVIEPFCKGRCPIAITYQADQARAELLLGDSWRVKPSNELLQQLKQVCGEQRVIVEYESA